MCHGFSMSLAQSASEILHSVVYLVRHCPDVEDLLLSCHKQSFSVPSDAAFIEALVCEGHAWNF